MTEYLIPHDADGKQIHTDLAGVNGRFKGMVTFLADAGSYTFLATVTTDWAHGKWEDTPGVGHVMAFGRSGIVELGGRTRVPDWEGGCIRLTDDNDRVLARCTEAMSHRVNYEGFIFGLTAPTQLWIIPSADLLDTPYSVILRHTPVQTIFVTKGGVTKTLTPAQASAVAGYFCWEDVPPGLLNL
jgi:hypothetical protein